MSDGVGKYTRVSHRPRVAVSACLIGERVRYDGAHKRMGAVADELAARVELCPVCPEVELGLGVPRETIGVARRGGDLVLLSASGRDLTVEMARFSAARIAALRELGIAGYVLKARSPSCAVHDAPVADAEGAAGPGMFARALMRALPELPVIDEEALSESGRLDRFVAEVHAYADRHRPCNVR